MVLFVGTVILGVVLTSRGLLAGGSAEVTGCGLGALIFGVMLMCIECWIRYSNEKDFHKVTKKRIEAGERGEVVRIDVTRNPPPEKWWRFWETI